MNPLLLSALQKAWDIFYWGVYYSFIRREKPSPAQRVPFAQIGVVERDGAAVLEVPLGVPAKDVWLTPVGPSNSMDPWFDEGDRVVLVRPTTMPADVGDMVVYARDGDDSDLIIHQIVGYREDLLGPYFICKGSNNLLPDALRVRPEWIRWVLVAAVY